MLPESMQFIDMSATGKPEVLQLGQRSVPVCGEAEVLIKSVAAGVNGPDIAQRRGLYPPPPGASDILGLEVSGEIVATGPAVTSWKVGDKVCALTNGGAYAQYVIAPQGQCLPIPQGLDIIDAAGLPETYFTVWSNFFFQQQFVDNALMLIHGGAGGIGSTAIQLGSALGMRVFTTCSSSKKAQFCEALGAERAINYKEEDFEEIVREAGGADIILDIVGGEYVNRNLRIANPDARIVQLAFNQGAKVSINMALIMTKRLVLTGSTLRPRPPEFKAAIASNLEKDIWPHFAAGNIKPVTHCTFKFEEAVKAHEMMESAAHTGKILLTF